MLPDSEKDSEGLCLRSVEGQKKAGEEQQKEPEILQKSLGKENGDIVVE